jgi:hypothetical protein
MNRKENISMAKRVRSVTNNSIQRKIKEKRNEGLLHLYKPWLTVRDVASRGMATRIKGWKTGRVHHLLSNLEIDYFFMLEWSPFVTDIREQYGLLPQAKTLRIAENLGIRHPVDPRTNFPIVMTTDFLITLQTPVGKKYSVRTVKPRDHLTRRVIEKFEIERRFFEDKGINWGFITENEIDYNLVHNVKWVHATKSLEGRPYLSRDVVNKVIPYLLEELANPLFTCSISAFRVDQKLCLPLGSSMYLLRHMIANRIWEIDMTIPIDPSSQSVEIINLSSLEGGHYGYYG